MKTKNKDKYLKDFTANMGRGELSIDIFQIKEYSKNI